MHAKGVMFISPEDFGGLGDEAKGDIIELRRFRRTATEAGIKALRGLPEVSFT
jgi:hypothetical protein